MNRSPASTVGDRLPRRQPHHVVGLGRDVAGALPLGQLRRRRTRCGSGAARRSGSASPTRRRAGRCAAPAPRRSRKSVSDRSRASSAARSASQSSPVVSATTVPASGPASSTPGLLERLAHGGADQRPRRGLLDAELRGPLRPASARPTRRRCRSRAGPRRRRGRRTCRPRTPSWSAGAAGRPRARRRRAGAAPRWPRCAARPGCATPSAYSRACVDQVRRQRDPLHSDLHDQLDLDRDVQRQHGHADGGAGVHAGVAEHLARAARRRRWRPWAGR